MPEINHTLYFHTGRLQKLMGKYVSFAMFLQHMALAVVFLHVFACAYLGHYGYETFGLDSNGHEYFYAQDTGGHLYYSAKVCNIRNLYNLAQEIMHAIERTIGALHIACSCCCVITYHEDVRCAQMTHEFVEACGFQQCLYA